MAKKSYPREVKWTRKLSEGGKIGGKNCPRGVKLDKTVQESQEKKMSEASKNPVLCLRG